MQSGFEQRKEARYGDPLEGRGVSVGFDDLRERAAFQREAHVGGRATLGLVDFGPLRSGHRAELGKVTLGNGARLGSHVRASALLDELLYGRAIESSEHLPQKTHDGVLPGRRDDLFRRPGLGLAYQSDRLGLDHDAALGPRRRCGGLDLCGSDDRRGRSRGRADDRRGRRSDRLGRLGPATRESESAHDAERRDTTYGGESEWRRSSTFHRDRGVRRRERTKGYRRRGRRIPNRRRRHARPRFSGRNCSLGGLPDELGQVGALDVQMTVAALAGHTRDHALRELVAMGVHGEKRRAREVAAHTMRVEQRGGHEDSRGVS